MSIVTRCITLLPRRHLFRFTFFFALAVVLVGSGCKLAVSPEAMLLQIREEARKGQLDVALRDVDAALGKYQSSSPEWSARFRVLKAHILMLRGSYSQSLEILNESLPPSLMRSETEVQRKMVQGLAHRYLQHFEAANEAISEAENLAATIHSTLVADVGLSRGILEMDLKNYAKAAASYRMAAAFAREHNLDGTELNALGSLGNVAMWQQHYDEALDRFKTALERSRSLASLRAEANALGNLGWNYSAVGDYENAESLLTEAEGKSARSGWITGQTYWLNSLADVYFRQHRYEEARSAEEKALELARGQDDKRTLTECLNTLSEIALATAHVDQAENYNEEALKIEESGLDHFGVTFSRLIAGRIAASKKQYPEAERAFQKIIGDRSVETPLRWEAQASLAQVHASMSHTVLAEREFGESINTISKAWNDLKREEFRLSFLSSSIRFYDAYVNFLIEQKRPLDALKIADQSRAQTLEHGLTASANGTASGTASAAKGKKASGPVQTAVFRPQEIARRWKATLLFYWLGEQRSHLWVITPEKVTLLPLPGRAEIDSAVVSYLEAFPEPRDPLEAGNANGKKLYETLIAPAEKLIPKDLRVVILPDSKLTSLNFETLIVPGEKTHYWIEDVTILTANSLALLSKTSPTAPPKDASLFLMGDALQASPDFPPLPQAGNEVGLVQGYFAPDKRSVLTKAQAVPSVFLRGKPEGFSYLHFATHGTASTLRPLESAVILSPEGDTYKLYARDIVQHPVHAYLVTISACNGAGMKTYAGEGLVGLAWAFLRAGAHNVIGGLWEVSNASTPQLMDELYRGLNDGKDPAVALRNAKLTLVHSTGNYRRPFYWGPFQLYAGT